MWWCFFIEGGICNNGFMRMIFIILLVFVGALHVRHPRNATIIVGPVVY